MADILALTTAAGWRAVVQHPDRTLEVIGLTCWGLVRTEPVRTVAVGLIHVGDGVCAPVSEVYGKDSKVEGELIGYLPPGEPDGPGDLADLYPADDDRPDPDGTRSQPGWLSTERLCEVLLREWGELKDRLGPSADARSVLDFVLADLRAVADAIGPKQLSSDRFRHLVTGGDDHGPYQAGRSASVLKGPGYRDGDVDVRSD